MNISNDILRYNLKNVYFLIGTACGGKTTMADAIAKKYGFIHFNDNYHEDNFLNWDMIQAERNKDVEPNMPDWEDYFNRKPEEFNESLQKSNMEYVEYALIEIIKLAQDHIVIADMVLPSDLVKELAPYNRVACLLASPELVVQDYFERDDHRDIYDCVMSLKDPEKSLRNLENIFRMGTQSNIEEVKSIGLFYLLRDEFSTVEKTMSLLEKHFELS